MKNRFTLLLVCWLVAASLPAQAQLKNQHWGIGVGVGAASSLSDLVTRNEQALDARQMRLNLTLTGKYFFNPNFNLRASLSYAKLLSDGPKPWYAAFGGSALTTNTSFVPLEVSAQLNAFSDGWINPYIHAGLGVLFYSTESNFAASGRGLNFSGFDNTGSPAEESSGSVAVGIPIGAGFEFFLDKNISLDMNATYTLSLTDYLDAFKSRNNDAAFRTTVGINVYFGRPEPPKPARIQSFVAEPATVDSGSSSALRWRVAYADTVKLDTVRVDTGAGTKTVTPAETRSYTLSATSAGGDTSATVTVAVKKPVPPPPPAPPAPPAKEPSPTPASADEYPSLVEFEKGKSAVKSTPELDESIKALKARNARLEITGHTCTIGSQALNQRLSKARAEAAKRYFVKRGYKPNLIRTVGKNFSEPVSENDTESGREQNRRVDVKVLSSAKGK